MASKGREFSVIPTLLLGLVIGAVVGVLLLLLFGRHVGHPDTVSAVNAGLPGTTVINRKAAPDQAAGTAASGSSGTTSPTGTTSTSTTTPTSPTSPTGTASSTGTGSPAATPAAGNQSASENSAAASGGQTATSGAATTGANTTGASAGAGAGAAAAATAGGAAGAAASGPSGAAVASTGTVNDTATSMSGTAIDAQKQALPLSETVVGNQFTGTGKQIYVQACQSCHQPGGVGARGAGIYPALANNPRLRAAAYPESMVLFGNGGMPGFGHYMNDQQVAEVVNYVRTELNKNTDKVTPDDIKKLRPTKPDYMIFGEAAG